MTETGRKVAIATYKMLLRSFTAQIIISAKMPVVVVFRGQMLELLFVMKLCQMYLETKGKATLV